MEFDTLLFLFDIPVDLGLNCRVGNDLHVRTSTYMEEVNGVEKVFRMLCIPRNTDRNTSSLCSRS